MTNGVRSDGARKIFIGIVGFGLIWAIIYFVRLQGFAPTSFGMIPLAFPGAYALIGFLEFIAGVPFSMIATKWDDLAGWQRGVLGILVVILAFFAAAVGMMLFG
ncbi:hypothetical protein YS110_04825 [Acidovorax sp. YS12]|nr:hypothetical protein YS110_04825 [Acidovorax sp. YS12]